MRGLLRRKSAILALVCWALSASGGAGSSLAAATAEDLAAAVGGLELRSIGPALMGGRIADIAIDPRDRSTWYVAVGSGGVWKTVNRGVTWRPLFDDQPSYSIGCVTLDPSNPDTVWVGTGENVSGRHVGWGDGVYRSLDGGKTWRQTGLERSEHIGKIIVDPRDGNVVYAAAEGPLWSSGGERGLYKSIDGGETWKPSLVIDADTGVTDVEIDPRNPDVLIAAAYQRRRHIWSLLAGGPGSGIYKSTDAGASWRRIDQGLPAGDMGKIGLAISPANPDVVYATIEASDEERGFYRSRDGGESWEKRNSYISNGTGPHYYQEIEASPHDVDTVYQMDVFFHVTRDGGATFDYLGDGRQKHSDNHALVIDPADPEHLIAGTDASIYESFDDGQTWRQFPNLPISQFYKLCLDNAEPFFNILGGAQDLGTLLGPSRTTNVEGVRNRDWFVPLGADGYACAFDPNDPNIAYMEWQGGRLQRYDRLSHELIDIRPVPAPGDPPERFNWDAPVIISPHDSKRLYFASQRVWRSDDQGSSWQAVSPDLTRDRNRYELEMIDRVWSVNALYDNGAMSLYGTITTLSESPLVEGLLYAGTDDGVVQVSENGGQKWRSVDFPDISKLLFVNDVQASLHDPDEVFVVLDAHKTGDYRPHILKSSDRGRTWRSIAGDLPEGRIAWALVQDHEVAELLFAGMEDGLYTSLDGGRRWHKLAGAPTIAFRDVAIQHRDDDLVGATFGRGFYILDDYSALRSLSKSLTADGTLFPVRDAWLYVPSVPGQAAGKPSMGSDDYTAPNPPFGAVLTYHLKDDRKTAAESRRESERQLRDQSRDVPFPGWDTLREEALEEAPAVHLTVRNADGEAVRRIVAPASKGLHRTSWDLRLPPPDPVNLDPPGFRPPWVSDPLGPLAPPGEYSVELAVVSSAGVETLGEAQSFRVKPVAGFSMGEPDFDAVAAFHRRAGELHRRAQGAARAIGEGEDRLRHLRHALDETPRASAEQYARLDQLEADLAELRRRLQGDRTRRRWNEATVPSILGRTGQVYFGAASNRQTPTQTQRQSLEIAATEFAELSSELKQFLETKLPDFEADVEAAGAPWTPGRKLPSQP